MRIHLCPAVYSPKAAENTTQQNVLQLSNEPDDDVKEHESQTTQMCKILTDTI